MVDSTRRPWDPSFVLIDGVPEYLRLRKDKLVPWGDTFTTSELEERARSSAAYARLVIRLLMANKIHMLHRR